MQPDSKQGAVVNGGGGGDSRKLIGTDRHYRRGGGGEGEGWGGREEVGEVGERSLSVVVRLQVRWSGEK